MNAVKKNNNKNEQQVIAELTEAAQQQLEASLVEFSSQLLNTQQQQLQGTLADIGQRLAANPLCGPTLIVIGEVLHQRMTVDLSVLQAKAVV